MHVPYLYMASFISNSVEIKVIPFLYLNVYSDDGWGLLYQTLGKQVYNDVVLQYLYPRKYGDLL